jgi:hypothetical protein
MGKLCSKQTQTVSNLIETEKEISVPTYKSDADKYYELQENKYNLFRKINFADYFYSLAHFSNENATLEDDYNKANIDYSAQEPFFSELFSNDILQSFIENKIFKHKSIYELAGNNETISGIFKEAFLQANDGLALKLSQNAKEKGDDSADKNTIVKKGNVIGYGLLYCSGANYIKIKALFNLFHEGGEIKPSTRLDEFLLSLFIIPSYGMASARNKLSKYDEIGSIEKETLKELLDSAQLKDCQNLVDVVKKLMFGNNLDRTLNYQAFKDKFELNDRDRSLGFMLSPAGVRYMLKKHNV